MKKLLVFLSAITLSGTIHGSENLNLEKERPKKERPKNVQTEENVYILKNPRIIQSTSQKSDLTISEQVLEFSTKLYVNDPLSVQIEALLNGHKGDILPIEQDSSIYTIIPTNLYLFKDKSNKHFISLKDENNLSKTIAEFSKFNMWNNDYPLTISVTVKKMEAKGNPQKFLILNLSGDSEEKIQKNVNEIEILTNELLSKKSVTKENLARLKSTVLAIKGLWGEGYLDQVSNYMNNSDWTFRASAGEEGRGAWEIISLYMNSPDQVKNVLKECFPDKK